MRTLEFIRARFRNTAWVRHVLNPINRLIRKYSEHRLRKAFKEHGLEVFSKVVAKLNNAGIRFWPEFGTLLGIYRDATFIPYDNDLDFGAFIEDRDRIIQELTSLGFTLKNSYYSPDYDYIREDTFEYGGLGVDFFFFHRDNSCDCCYSFVPNELEIGNTLNYLIKVFKFNTITLKSIIFKDHLICIPDDTEAHLKVSYGENFMTPDPYFKSINHNYLENHYGYHKEF